ncbi:MAG: FIST N-terminal domain-containing protein [Candidatus Omnitrophica bacterium]|nr:FIST N-terminal domain-containing protein [Candidatus Omnitrophota bacterium]
MSIHIGVGFSKDENPFRAAQNAAAQAKIQTKENPVHLVIIFSTIHYSRIETIRVVRETFPDAKIVGCSTSGLILSKTIETWGVSILAIGSQEIHFGVSCIKNISRDKINLDSSEIAKKTLKDFGLNRRQISLLLTDGLSQNNSMLLKGIQESLGLLSPILGAGSSDDFQSKKTYQYFENEILTDSAAVIIMGGRMTAGFSSQHGWKPLGKPRIITKAEKNIIKKINNKKAISIYEEFFADQAASLFSNRLNRMRDFYPLGMLIEGEKKYLLQQVVNVTHEGDLICQGEIPEGTEVHIMIGNKDSCRDSTLAAACEVKESLFGRTPDVIIVFESVSRQKLLGRNVFQEIQIIKEVLGENVPIFGMYAYGEFAPLGTAGQAGQSFLQNETISILAIEHHKVY